jgi:hypothetical protein
MCGEGGNLSTRDLSFIYVSSAGWVGCEFLHPAKPTDAPSSGVQIIKDEKHHNIYGIFKLKIKIIIKLDLTSEFLRY